MEENTYLEYAKKQYRMTRLIACMVAGIFLTVLLAAAVVVPRAARVMEQAEQVITDLETVTADLEQVDLPGLAEHMDGLIQQSGEGLAEALEKLESMDMETLNKAIQDLQAIVEPMAKLFRR